VYIVLYANKYCTREKHLPILLIQASSSLYILREKSILFIPNLFLKALDKMYFFMVIIF